MRVTCIMPTNVRRRAWLPHAIENFHAQEYRDKELLVIDDGGDESGENVADLCVSHGPEVIYFRRPVGTSVGAKLNFGCEIARGDTFVEWDDDDWSAPWRLAYQAWELRASGAPVCGLAAWYYLAGDRAYLYHYPPDQPRWLAGSTMAWTRAWWEAHRFPSENVGLEAVFLDGCRDARAHDVKDWFVATMHDGNHTPKRIHSWYTSVPMARLERLMGPMLDTYVTLTTRGETAWTKGTAPDTSR